MKVKPVNQPETRVLCLKVRSVNTVQAVPHLAAASILEPLSYSHRDAEPLLRRHYCGARKQPSGADEPAGGKDSAPSQSTAWCSDWLLLNIHFHMLFLDGAYADRQDGTARFRRVGSPTNQELTRLTQIIARRVGRFLEGQGLLERDAENNYLITDALPGGSMDQLLGHSITYRIAVGPQAGRKVFTLQTLPARNPEEQYSDTAGKIAGFSLHAGVAARSDERKKLERLCRYVSRPAVSEKRLSLTSYGNIRYQLKTPYRESLPHER
jgi:hypothetical protein